MSLAGQDARHQAGKGEEEEATSHRGDAVRRLGNLSVCPAVLTGMAVAVVCPAAPENHPGGFKNTRKPAPSLQDPEV